MSISINFNGGYTNVKNINMKELEKYILSKDISRDWSGAGDGWISIIDNDIPKHSIMIGIGYNDNSFILQCRELKDRVIWYPINDMKFIDRAKEYSDECYAAEGCFLTQEDTWIVLKDFYLTGERSKNFKWIKSSDLPPFKNMDDYFNVTKTY